MTAALPDVSLTGLAPASSPLQWVGMQGIDLPITLDEPGCRHTLHARADAQVDLPAPHIKGIHMSRLYQLLDALSEGETVSPSRLQQLLKAMVDSHQDCESRSARLRFNFELLAKRPALVSENLAGWKAYPVRLDVALVQGVYTLRLQVKVAYSSTCPCSAALSRQLVEHGFQDAFAGQARVDATAVADWLRQNASLATPHSQRSEAHVSVDVAGDASNLGLLALIDRIEDAVGTPVQTAVKRADEQAFAALNGQNLMFVEDAARRLEAALTDNYANACIHVCHLESLHPHDAVAWAGAGRDEVAP